MEEWSQHHPSVGFRPFAKAVQDKQEAEQSMQKGKAWGKGTTRAKQEEGEDHDEEDKEWEEEDEDDQGVEGEEEDSDDDEAWYEPSVEETLVQDEEFMQWLQKWHTDMYNTATIFYDWYPPSNLLDSFYNSHIKVQ